MRPFRVRPLFHALAPLMLALSLGLAGCDDDLIGPVDPEDVEFATSLGVTLDEMTRLASGVYIQTLEEGEGAGLKDGDRGNVAYTLWLPDGSEMDSNEAWEFDMVQVGQVGQVVPLAGFYLGMLGAREGETRLIVIPSELGYGEAGNGPIPGGAVLVFRVRVNTITDPDAETE